MRLIEYLEPMKTLPNRFSNLAFWRVLRTFKDEVVNALTYVDTWGQSIESDYNRVSETLNSHETKISTIQSDQSTQDSKIGSNSAAITDLSSSVETMSSDLDALKKLTFDASLNFKSNTYADPKASFSNLGGDLYVVQTTTGYLELPTVPFHVRARASISVYTNEAHTSTVTIAIPMAFSVVTYSGKTRILVTPTAFYAPYGVNKLTALYITYLTHV